MGQELGSALLILQGTDCHRDVTLFLPRAESRGGFSAPAANSDYLLLSTAALAANKFYGAMAWRGFCSFFKSKTGNTQSKMHVCIFFDIHGEHSWLLPGAWDVGMREKMILQSPHLSPQSAFEEIWMIGVILYVVLAGSQLFILPSTAEVGNLVTYVLPD